MTRTIERCCAAKDTPASPFSQGVLALAASFVGALGALFPSSIDRLPPDAGVFAGPRPLVVPSSMSPDALVSQMLSGGASFGARQV